MKWLILTGLLLGGQALAQQPQTLLEPPYFAPQVEQGELPPLSQRLPQTPLVDSFETLPGRSLGLSGGTINLLMGKAKDVRQLVVYGYARLVGFNESMQLQADILQDYQVEEGRIFTLHLRPGHRWSDGAPFTSEDFRYFWESMANNEELYPFGPPNKLLVEGKPPIFEVLDRHTVRYSWHRPNPEFLLALAGPRPLYIYRPSHYMKQFHPDYADPDELADKVAKAKTKKKSWVALHQRKDHQYKFDNPDLPTLQPWMPVTKPPAERFHFVRNPYYHRLDTQGNQLPYLDELIVDIASGKLVPAKTGSGESDLQGRYLSLDDYTFLHEGASRNHVDVMLWRTSRGSRMSLYPNLNAVDPVWQPLLRDVRFRRALSLAVNRYEINQVIFFGLALEGADSLLPESPLFKPQYRSRWAEFDLVQANALMDQLGLTERDPRGIRLLPDGRPMEIIIQSAGGSTEESDILELIHDSWMQIGVKIHTKPTEREVFRNRIFAGEALMSVWTGLPNAIPSSDMSPAELAPTTQQQLQWSQWGKHYETGQGEAPVLPEAQRLLELNNAWRQATNAEQRTQIWQQMLDIYSDQVYSIGTVARVLQPIVIRSDLRNVPAEGLWNWEPNSYFGVYRPDRFWLDPALSTTTNTQEAN
ncbi:ABC transporter substrate-binding protein [Motiliproteus sp.]|uniref:ABC transporter substrate-binding protein n=1 Tax=Motiliproteus sp. TaxID=1898955 RepID=UPI003BABF685